MIIKATFNDSDTLRKYTDDYLSKELHVKLISSVTDEWQNGEVVYYFPTADKFITMLEVNLDGKIYKQN